MFDEMYTDKSFEHVHSSLISTRPETMCSRIINLALILGVLYCGSLAECPNGWVTYNVSCYLFDHSSLTFKEAEALCNQEAGHLVEIETPEENAFLANFAKYLKSTTYWIGLTDEHIEQTWQWLTSNVVPNYTGWYKGRPVLARTRNCAMLYGAGAFQWYDVACTGARPAICERSKYSETDNGLVG